MRGGKELDVRVVAHSAAYHSVSRSLLVYGGVVAGVARFSRLSDRMFAFELFAQHWSELRYPRAHLRDTYVPRERAFHSSTIIGEIDGILQWSYFPDCTKITVLKCIWRKPHLEIEIS